MNAPDDVDRGTVERNARRRELLPVVPLAAWFVSLVTVTGEFAFWRDTGAWWAIAGYALFFLGMVLLTRRVPRLRRLTTNSHRLQFALRHHLDPGPVLRSKVDVMARRQARLRWSLWAWPLPVAVFLLAGRWDRPVVTVPAALVLVGVPAAGAALLRRQLRYARRWVEDPPGPAREVPPPGRLEQLASGRRLVLVALAVFVLGFGGGLTAALLS